MSVIDFSVAGVTDSKELGRHLHEILTGADPALQGLRDQLRGLIKGADLKRLEEMEHRFVAGKMPEGTFFAQAGAIAKEGMAKNPALKPLLAKAVEASHQGEQVLHQMVEGLKSLDVAGATHVDHLRPMIKDGGEIFMRLQDKLQRAAAPFLRATGADKLREGVEKQVTALCGQHHLKPEKVMGWLFDPSSRPKRMNAAVSKQLDELGASAAKATEASQEALTKFFATPQGKHFQSLADKFEAADHLLGQQAQKLTGKKNPAEAMLHVMNKHGKTAHEAAGKTKAEHVEKGMKAAGSWVQRMSKSAGEHKGAVITGVVAIAAIISGIVWYKHKHHPAATESPEAQESQSR
jgi:hypothetical protein